MGEMASDLTEGLCCSWCGIYFKETHGYPVICTACAQSFVEENKGKGIDPKEAYKKLSLQVAVHKES